MLARLAELQISWRAQRSPVLEIGIGINTGIASVGSMGSSLRYAYTAMGDTVNLAARLESLNKEYGTQILISEFTRSGIHSGELVLREIDFIRVKGKLQPVTIYEVLGPRAKENDGPELVKQFSAAREAYKRRNWRAAQSAWTAILAALARRWSLARLPRALRRIHHGRTAHRLGWRLHHEAQINGELVETAQSSSRTTNVVICSELCSWSANFCAASSLGKRPTRTL